MTTLKPAFTLLVGLVLVPATARSQATPLPPPTGDSLIQEIRLLRQALERQATGSARVQLLVGRLAVQDQRVARTQEAAERMEGESFALEQQRRRMDAEVRELTRLFEQEADDARRTELEGKLRMAKARYQELDARLTALERELLGSAR